MCSRRDKDPEKIPALADVVTDNWENIMVNIIALS